MSICIFFKSAATSGTLSKYSQYDGDLMKAGRMDIAIHILFKEFLS